MRPPERVRASPEIGPLRGNPLAACLAPGLNPTEIIRYRLLSYAILARTWIFRSVGVLLGRGV